MGCGRAIHDCGNRKGGGRIRKCTTKEGRGQNRARTQMRSRGLERTQQGQESPLTWDSVKKLEGQ